MTEEKKLKPFTPEELTGWYRESVQGAGRAVGGLVEKMGVVPELNEKGLRELQVSIDSLNKAYIKMYVELTGGEPSELWGFADVVRPYLFN